MTEPSFSDGFVYRLSSEESWAQSKASGEIAWEAHDERDGFLHLSGADQAQGSALRHYGDELGLLAVAMRKDALSDLRWEESTGGEMFPHHYGAVPLSAVDHVLRLTRGMAGSYIVVAKLDP